MKSPPVKQHWIDKCIDIHNFHINQLKTEGKWTLEDSAAALSRSVGAISQALSVASWLRTHEKILRKFRNEKDALVFIRAKKKEILIREIET